MNNFTKRAMTAGTAGALLAAILVPHLGGSSVRADHSLPDPPVYRDCNGDHVADDVCIKAYKAGTGWGTAKSARFIDAIDEWSDNSQYDPKTDPSVGDPIYLDRLGPCISDWTPGGGLVILGVVCLNTQWKGAFGYYAIHDTPTYIVPPEELESVGLHWANGTAAPELGSGDIHFGGNLVHELGHWIKLDDLSCQAGPTMCNENLDEVDIFHQYTIQADDIDAANAVY